MERKAIFAGSFDPYTVGHHSIVKKVAKMFDTVYVVIFANSSKKRTYDANKMVEAIKKCLENEGITNCIVSCEDGLLAQFALKNGIDYTVRGLRNNMDYNYEENIAEVNKILNPDLESIYVRADNVGISSSMVRELLKYNSDVSAFVPKEVLEVIKEDK